MTTDDEAIATYRAEPSGRTLKPLIVLGPPQLREALLAVYRDKPHWRTAQHLVLAWLNRFGQSEIPPDLVRAAYFAHKACELSNGHPLALVVRAEVYWERRLAHLVLDDVTSALDGINVVDDEHQRSAVTSQLLSLQVCSLAYLGRLREALDLAARAVSGVSDEAVIQCFIATRGDRPDLQHEAALLAVSRWSLLGQRPLGELCRVLRRALLQVLAAKGDLGDGKV